MNELAMKVGWFLMKIPAGIRRPSVWVLRYGPYRWGGALFQWGFNRDHRHQKREA